MKPDTKEHLVHRYLLGDLPDDEQLALERDYFTNPEVFERVWEIENDLVDRYVRGMLNRNEKTLFEQNYLASPVHRERVTFATALLERADSAAGKAQSVRGTVPPISWWAVFLASLRGNLWHRATIAAVVLLLGGGIVFLGERARLHRQIDQLKAESSSQQQRAQELEKEIAAQRDQNDKLASELASEESKTDEGSSQTPPRETRSVLSLVLSPMSMRSGGEAQQLKLSNETAAVVLQMKVGQPGARVYQVDLRTVEGIKVWSRSSVKARPSANDNSTISITIPAGKLATGDYILTLSATINANETEEINRYFFRISKE